MSATVRNRAGRSGRKNGISQETRLALNRDNERPIRTFLRKGARHAYDNRTLLLLKAESLGRGAAPFLRGVYNRPQALAARRQPSAEDRGDGQLHSGSASSCRIGLLIDLRKPAPPFQAARATGIAGRQFQGSSSASWVIL